MYNSIKTPLITAALVLATASSAIAQDQFEVKITRPAGTSVEVSYKAMAKQARKFCKREARSMDGRGIGARVHKYTEECTAEIMEKAVAKIRDPYLTAYHQDLTNNRPVLAGKTRTVK